MLYKALGNSGVKVSAISFGAMRWPSEEAAWRIVNRGLDLGLNYLDTSTGYVGGNSEKWSAAAVRGRRGEIYFSDKCNWDLAPTADAVRAAIDKSLKAAGLEYLDFYQLWGLHRQETLKAALAKGGFVEGVRQARKEGLVRHGLGFTFHGEHELFRQAVDSGEFCCATVSYNLMNRQAEEDIQYAAAKGVGVIIMNPLAGGLLGLAGDKAVDFLCQGHSGPWYGALRFLLANAGITASIVGFTAEAEVDQAVSALEGSQSLGDDYRAGLVDQIDRARFVEGNFCTGCGYCKDCPQGFIPSAFMKAMRDFTVYGVRAEDLRHWILSQFPHQDIYADLARCCECGQCQDKCPQHLAIVESICKGKDALGIK